MPFQPFDYPLRATLRCILVALVTCSHGILVANSLGQLAFPHNSTVKRRPLIDAQTRRCGTAIQWETDFEVAKRKSHQTQRPIFWYVPTLRGTFMDRQDSIDLYMRAGMFSWPQIVDIINRHFIPLNAEPSPEQQEAYQLKPYRFIEPGFLILDGNGKIDFQINRLTTQHPRWLTDLLSQFIHPPAAAKLRSPQLEQVWQNFASSNFQQTLQLLQDENNFYPEERIECGLLQGMAEFRMGQHQRARDTWRQVSQLAPEHPLAWKAAAEAAGVGPFIRGFEVHQSLPEAALQAGIQSIGSSAPAGVYESEPLWERGIEFLLGMQSENGSWTDCDYDFGGTDSLPNVHAAVTSIAAMSILEFRFRQCDQAPGLNEQQLARLDHAVAQASAFVADNTNLNFNDSDEIFWACVYRVNLFTQLAKRDPEQFSKVTTLQRLVDELVSIQAANGSWFHEYENPFVTATALNALHDAVAVGAQIEPNVIDRGLASLLGNRYGNGAFPYENNPVFPSPGNDTHVVEAAGRMPWCELALRNWERSTDDAVLRSVRTAIERNQSLMLALKYDDHTSHHQYGGFFVWFDLLGRSQTLASLPDSPEKQRLQKFQLELIQSLPEIDGCFVDSHELGRVYGTAMALLSLAALNE